MVGSSSRLPAQQLAPRRVGNFRSRPVLPPQLRSWLRFQPSATTLCTLLLRFCAAPVGALVNASQFAPGMVPSLFQGRSLEGMPSPKTFKASEAFCSPYGGLCLQMCALCCLGSVPCFSSCPRRPLKRCHHRIAGNRCPGTFSWLCPSKQTVISSKSSEVSLLVFG